MRKFSLKNGKLFIYHHSIEADKAALAAGILKFYKYGHIVLFNKNISILLAWRQVGFFKLVVISVPQLSRLATAIVITLKVVQDKVILGWRSGQKFTVIFSM